MPSRSPPSSVATSAATPSPVNGRREGAYSDRPLIRLATATSSAAIAPLGAEPQSWRIAGRELLWSGDPAFWPQHSPILFPVVGWTRNGEMRIKGARLIRWACTASRRARNSSSCARRPTRRAFACATTRRRGRSFLSVSSSPRITVSPRRASPRPSACAIRGRNPCPMRLGCIRGSFDAQGRSAARAAPHRLRGTRVSPLSRR